MGTIRFYMVFLQIYFVVHEQSAVKNSFSTYVCYDPDALFGLNLQIQFYIQQNPAIANFNLAENPAIADNFRMTNFLLSKILQNSGNFEIFSTPLQRKIYLGVFPKKWAFFLKKNCISYENCFSGNTFQFYSKFTKRGKIVYAYDQNSLKNFPE